MSNHHILELKEKLDRLRAVQFYFLEDLRTQWEGTGDYMAPMMRLPMLDLLNELGADAVDYCAALAKREETPASKEA